MMMAYDCDIYEMKRALSSNDAKQSWTLDQMLTTF